MQQLGALAGIGRELMSLDPSADILAPARAVAAELRSLKQAHPSSPYAALAQLDEISLSGLNAEAVQAAQHQRALTAMEGKPAPAFRLNDVSGGERSISDYRGRVLLINFFASW